MNRWSLIIWKFRLQRNNVLSFLQRIKQMQKPGIRRNLGAAVLAVPSAVPSDVRLFLCILSLDLYPFYTTRFSMPPSRYEAIFFCTSPIRRVRASFDAQAMCGVMYRRSSSAIFSNGLSLRIGSLESTSSAAQAIRPSRRAQQRSRSFTIEPRPTLIRIAFRFMLANVSIFIRFSVASFNGAWMETTSESFSRR